MIYATVADLVSRFGQTELVQLTDTSNMPPSVIDAARVATKIDDAAAFVDGYVGQAYRLPLAGCAKPNGAGGFDRVAPPVLVRLTCDLARYYLFTDVLDEKHEAVRRQQSAVKELAAIASGATQLACPWGGAAGEPLHADALQEDQVYHSFAPRPLDADALRGY